MGVALFGWPLPDPHPYAARRCAPRVPDADPGETTEPALFDAVETRPSHDAQTQHPDYIT